VSKKTLSKEGTLPSVKKKHSAKTFFAECFFYTRQSTLFAECFFLPSVFSLALEKNTRQTIRHSAKSRIPAVVVTNLVQKKWINKEHTKVVLRKRIMF
jgi:hypothetical protein